MKALFGRRAVGKMSARMQRIHCIVRQKYQSQQTESILKALFGGRAGGKMSDRMQRIIFMILNEGSLVLCAFDTNLSKWRSS